MMSATRRIEWTRERPAFALAGRIAAVASAAAVAAAMAVPPASAAEKQERCSATAEECLRMMADNLTKKGWIGIEMRQKDDKGRPVITHVVRESPAVKAGFEIGDVLAGINGVSEEDGEEATYAEWKRAMVPANKIVVTVLRKGRPVDLPVTLGTIPDAVVAQWIGQHMLEEHLAAAPSAEEKPGAGSP